MGETKIRLNAMRRYVGKSLQYSVTTYPQASGFFQADTTELLRLKEEQAARGIRVSFTAYVTKAVCIALRDFPNLNARVEGETMIVYDEINPGIAVADDKGLYVMVIHHGEKKSPTAISAEIRALTQKVQDGQVTPEDMVGGTITISSAGTGRTEIFTSIVTNDQAMIIGIGRTKQQPVVLADGTVGVRHMTWFATNMNHLLTDGRPVSRFRTRLAEILEDPRQYLAE
jgi:pyruvate/2-oxoglutarate dehydrogenase complex dihydrolipoamide acyltransferase (E2) component